MDRDSDDPAPCPVSRDVALSLAVCLRSPLWERDPYAPQQTADEIWNEWYAPFFQYIHDNSDVIRTLAYINANWDSQPMWSKPYRSGYWGDSRVQANDEIKQRWLAEIEGDFWLNASSDLFEILDYVK